jgi:arsenate reductase
MYHNPRCSKSRQTLALLQEKGCDPVIIEYLKTPPTPEELDTILRKLGMEPQDLLRTNEKRYSELDLGTKTLSRDELIQIMVDNPVLIERPIVLTENQAAIGRPPEAVLDLL